MNLKFHFKAINFFKCRFNPPSTFSDASNDLELNARKKSTIFFILLWSKSYVFQIQSHKENQFSPEYTQFMNVKTVRCNSMCEINCSKKFQTVFQFLNIRMKRELSSPGLVAQTCNLSYLGGLGWRIDSRCGLLLRCEPC